MPRDGPLDDSRISTPVAQLHGLRPMPPGSAQPLHDALQHDLAPCGRESACKCRAMSCLSPDDIVERHPGRGLVQAPLTGKFISRWALAHGYAKPDANAFRLIFQSAAEQMENDVTEKTTFTLDIGGEGRHREAWNLNPSPVKTRGPDRGKPIPQLILGRAEAIPLPDDSVDRVIVERTPMKRHALEEIERVISPRGTIILRHAVPPIIDPHRLAIQLLPGRIQQRAVRIDGQPLHETIFRNDQPLFDYKHQEGLT